MAANANDLFMEVGNPGTATTLSAPGYTAGGTTITVGSTSNWPTATGTIFAIDEAEVVDGKEVQIAGTYNEFEGVVSTGTSVTSVDWVRGVGDRSYSAGALTRVYVPVSAERENRLAQGMSVQHNQNGTHSAITATSGVFTGAVTASSFNVSGSGSGGGWDGVMSGTISAVTNNGNRSYDLTTSADNSALISPGMRLRTTRTVAAPTQSTSLNGTNQSWSKTSPAGMTFTDDFTVSAWVKLSSYPTSTGIIMSRLDATGLANGWSLYVHSTGQVFLIARLTSSANYKIVNTYQSLPLNKWVHIAGHMDLSSFTTTTNKLYFDGVEVPATLTTGGTITAISQTGDLVVGGRTGGADYFPGKIAQAAVFSSILSASVIRGYISQGLAGTETSLVSAYSFNGVATDLNTTNTNNLTANGVAVATNADSPFGGQAGGTISSTLDYGIVQKVTSTTLTVQAAEGCTIPTSGGVASASYATVNPFGFPGQKGKWDILVVSRIDATVSGPTANLWYNINSMKINLPVGSWTLGHETPLYADRGASGPCSVLATLSTASNTQSDPEFTGASEAGAGVKTAALVKRDKEVDTTAATDYFLNVSTRDSTMGTLFYLGSLDGTQKIYARNAYL